MPTPQELELLALLEGERRRNATTVSHEPGPVLPDLTPDMLLSASARREVEAARHFSGARQAIETRMSPEQVRASRVPMERVGFDMDDTGLGDIDLDAEIQSGSLPHDAMLNSLFMGREAQEAQAVLGGGSTYAASGYDVEFDADSMLEGRTAPNPTARFQVGRQSPPRMPFSATRLEGPSDGMVVSSREPGGGWQRAASMGVPRAAAASTRPSPEMLREMTRMPGREVQAPTPPQRTVSRQNIPSVYQHIMRGGAIDDD